MEVPVLFQSLAVGFVGGLAAGLFTSYLGWLFELRKRAFDALAAYYDSFVSACNAVSNFYFRTAGLKNVDLGYNPDRPNRPEVQAYWETREKLLALRIQINRITIFLNSSERQKANEKWEHIWKGLHDSGLDPRKDEAFIESLPATSDEIAILLKAKLMTFRGFIRSVSG